MGLVNSDEKDIIDIDLDKIKKKSFRINGDNNKILQLNLSDMNIVDRLQEGYKNISEIMERISNLDTEDPELGSKMREADIEIRAQLDYIFDANVSEVCGDSGTMYDPFGGSFRFEHILDTLTKLYETNLNMEYKKIKNRIAKHTSKYTKK